MKTTTCFALVMTLAVLAGVGLFGAPPAEPNGKEPEIPGSAALPPKTIEAPQPPPSGKRQDGIRVGVWINEKGLVDEVELLDGSKGWSEAVRATVKKWRFEPVMWQGKAITARTEVGFTQENPKEIRMSMSPVPNLPGETHTDEEFGVTKALIEQDPDLIVPLMVRAKGQRIEAALEYVINEEGVTDKIKILGATSEGAVRSALDMVAHRKYQPATIRDQPVIMAYKQILGLQSMDGRIEALSGAVEGVDPVYPYERFLAREPGDATVRFTLDAKGAVDSVELVNASQPEFGAALIAAVESWSFSPAAAAENPVREYKHDFAEGVSPYAARRLLDLVREGKSVSKSGVGLDAKPKLLACPELAYPTALKLENVSGSAKIEFVIDRVGLAQVPRVVEATRPEFGWAAATLVAGMRFVPPTRSGKPTDLRVIMPINFQPPNKSEPAVAAP